MTNFSKKLLGKELDSLTYADVKNYFTQVHDESDLIEYKSFPPRANIKESYAGIIRAACALLNSSGGIIIWGAPTGKPDPSTNKLTFTGNLEPLSVSLNKDSIISKLSDSVTPLPVGINVQPLEDNGSFLYIFEVQASNYKPHQFASIYWARLDGQTKPAPHYLVDALFKQIRYPNIEAYLKLHSMRKQPHGDLVLDFTLYFFNFTPLQNEHNVSYQLLTTLGGFANTYHQSERQIIRKVEPSVNFGAPISHDSYILITGQEYLLNNGMLHILLTFSGKSSPIKHCDYEIDLKNVPRNKPLNMQEICQRLNENVSAIEIHERLGSTRESVLQHALGRQPK